MIFRFRQLSQWLWSIGLVSMFTLVLILQQQPPPDQDDVIDGQHQLQQRRREAYDVTSDKHRTAARVQTFPLRKPGIERVMNASRGLQVARMDTNSTFIYVLETHTNDKNGKTLSNTQDSVKGVVSEVNDADIPRSKEERDLLRRTADPEVAASIRLFFRYQRENEWLNSMIPDDQRVLPSTCPPTLTEISSDGALPRTGLLSFPGSGNTWVRHLIQLATGKMTGSNYNDVSLKRTGFPGEGQHNGHMIVNKNHETGDVEMHKYDRAVVITRNPYDAVTSEFNRRRSGHLGRAKEHTFKSEKSLKEIAVMADWWEVFHIRWLKLFPHPIHVVRYENLRRDLRNELRKLLAFLGWSVSNTQLDCVASLAEGRNHRKGSSTFDPFTPTQRQLMRESSRRVELLIANRTLPVIT